MLIVEDDMNLRVVCEMTLVSGGYNFHSVDGTLQAIACLNEGQSFDLILTDFKIPGQIDGQTFINEVRLMGIHTPAIITSGYEFDDSSLPNGTCFLAKPYTLRSLLDLVKDCLNKNGDDVG
ncbi:response regulator [Xanthomonas arboricola pv. juglandis]|uniref:response regulator n=1 Tax=Xanthomonas arboricola TaxID=56448 RepID=UPI0009BA3289|nr:response regulator [Xanthomonas arboricola]MDN0221569.1 response regulator [Xanthomonas arboricola pv. juglandis]MDN0225843.1 response regulator [Xanthomonas arboricola pv. juglandis]MDN0230009.1 response regulator [Xanthomonas arboricola pv. juglandis]MDN0234325.1 response regulator [Xanthomonas arboricola pv. juglandis]MDN0238622.1 response regulator [Xanthomonas arboricola pv. juglandis]